MCRSCRLQPDHLQFRWEALPVDDVFQETYTKLDKTLGEKIPVWMLFNHTFDKNVVWDDNEDKQFCIGRDACQNKDATSVFTISEDAKGDSKKFHNEYYMEQLKPARAKFKVSANLFCLDLKGCIVCVGHTNAPADTKIMNLYPTFKRMYKHNSKP